MIYNDVKFIDSTPNVLYRNDNFLNAEEILHYQQLLKNDRWTLGNPESFDLIRYISQDLYCHYQWDGNWDSARWLDSTPPDWEELYLRISKHLPKHFVHWVDVKITSTSQGGTPLHRDRDPWSPGGDPAKFKKAITIICNLNSVWDPVWGGGLHLHNVKVKNNQADIEIDQTIPVVPGQLLIVENCYHSVELITEPSKSRVSFILHVLEYQQDDST